MLPHPRPQGQRSLTLPENDSRIACGALICAGLVCLLLAGLSTRPAHGFVKFDFEQKFYVHPGTQVWDFCLVKDQNLFHLFYHGIPETNPSAVNADTIWHASSPDLYYWELVGPTITSGPKAHDAEAIWAPDVIWDSVRRSWVMLYTGVDTLMVQRTCAAHTFDFNLWYKNPWNPMFEPDSTVYNWSPTKPWSSFRDPFIFFENNEWHMLNTASVWDPAHPGVQIGILHHATSTALTNWVEGGIFFAHNGVLSWHELESSQYHVRGDWHHLFFAEINVPGTSHLVADSVGTWDMADWYLLERGAAPEIDQFDGVDIYSRLGIDRHQQTQELFYVVRFDTMTFDDDGQTPVVHKPHPLDRNWIYHDGPSVEANPTFGDNTAERGEPPCGMVGNGWFGSKEFYQGPLSSTGTPGAHLGDVATGELKSKMFTVTGNSIRFLIGGGNYPETCYIALVDFDADTILVKSTGEDNETMVWRAWDVSSYYGLDAFIHIVDQETGTFGHINIDEIEEVTEVLTSAGTTPSVMLMDLGPRPNPSNPKTEIRFSLNRDAHIKVMVHDLRGRLIWKSVGSTAPAGSHAVVWDGRDVGGGQTPTGVYIYSILVDGRRASSGKITLVK